MPDVTRVELPADDEAFRAVVREWLGSHVVGEFAELRGRGGPGDEEVGFDIRVAWEQVLGQAGMEKIAAAAVGAAHVDPQHRQAAAVGEPRGTPQVEAFGAAAEAAPVGTASPPQIG